MASNVNTSHRATMRNWQQSVKKIYIAVHQGNEETLLRLDSHLPFKGLPKKRIQREG